MKRILSNKGILVVNAISIMVAFLTHFPEVISLFSGGVVDVVFPGLHWAEVANEMLFTYISLLLLFLSMSGCSGLAVPSGRLAG